MGTWTVLSPTRGSARNPITPRTPAVLQGSSTPLAIRSGSSAGVNGVGDGEGKIENVGYMLSFKKGGGIEKGEGVSVKYESKAGAVR